MGPSYPPVPASLTPGSQACGPYCFLTQILAIKLGSSGLYFCLLSYLSSPAWIDSWHLSPCNSIKPTLSWLQATKVHSLLTVAAGFDYTRKRISLGQGLVGWNTKTKMVFFVSLVGPAWLLLSTLVLLTVPPAPFQVARSHSGLRKLAQTVKTRKPRRAQYEPRSKKHESKL